MHKITKAYLNKATKKFALSDTVTARKKFDSFSRNTFKLRIKSVEDTSADGIKLRIYRNSSVNIKSPVVIYFHGGGFVLGSIDSYDSVCRYLSKCSNCVVISVEYSLAPESLYPVPVSEGLRVLYWLRQNGEKEGFDTSKIYLAGDSAGGNIALCMAIDSNLHTNLKGLVLIYPALDPRLSTESMQRYTKGYFLTKSMLRQFWGLYLGGKELYRFPADSELKDIPPVLVIAAEKDVLRDEGFNFVQRLRSLNN
jgi:acetyl esterase